MSSPLPLKHSNCDSDRRNKVARLSAIIINLKERKKKAVHYKDTHAVRSILAGFNYFAAESFFRAIHTREMVRFLGKCETPCEQALKISIIIVIDAPVVPATPLSILACIDRCHHNFRIACHITCHLSFPAKPYRLGHFSLKVAFSFCRAAGTRTSERALESALRAYVNFLSYVNVRSFFRNY